MHVPIKPSPDNFIWLDRSMREFHLEEYKQIKSDASALLDRIESLFKYSIVVVAATYSWMISNTIGWGEHSTTCLKAPPMLDVVGWILPTIFVLGNGMAARTARSRVADFSNYLQKLENALGSPRLGWEKHLGKVKDTITETGKTAWNVLLFITSVSTTFGIVHVINAVGACSPK